MSTNYYIAIDRCPHCGRCEEKIHIGKKSCGWSFTFHGYEDKGVVDYESWKSFIKDKELVDEYDKKVSYDDLIKLIEESKDQLHDKSNTIVINGKDFLFCDFC